MHLDRRLWAEGAFVLVADDDDAYPRVEAGDWLLLHPVAQGSAPAEGDLVVVRDGSRARIRAYHRSPEGVRLDSARADVPPIRGVAARFPVVGRVVWILRPLAGSPPPRRREPDGGSGAGGG